MNILFLTKEYKHESTSSSGGSGCFIANIAKLLVKENHNVTVFCSTDFDLEIDDCGVKVCFKNKLSKKSSYFKLIRSFSKKLKLVEWFKEYSFKKELKYITKQTYKFITKNNLDLDIIETHDFDGMSLYLNKKIPYIIRCHGSFSIFSKYFNFDVNEVLYKLNCEKKATLKAKNIITVSEYSKKINHELFDLKSSKLIYNGIDTELFILNKSIKKIPHSIFFLGNLSFEKGADIAIETLIELAKTFKDCSLHFLGIETNFKKEIECKIKENQLDIKVIYHGFQSTENIITILSAAEIVISPSRGENFSLSLLESMSLSKTIVCSDLPSYKEVIIDNQNGFIAKSIEDYVNKITYCFNNKEQSSLISINARKTVVENFNQNKMVNETILYYHEVLSKIDK